VSDGDCKLDDDAHFTVEGSQSLMVCLKSHKEMNEIVNSLERGKACWMTTVNSNYSRMFGCEDDQTNRKSQCSGVFGYFLPL